MAVGDANVFPGFLTPVLTQLFFPKPPTTFLTCFCRGERRKYAGKKSRLNRGWNSQPPGHESDALTTEPPVRGEFFEKINKQLYMMNKSGRTKQRTNNPGDELIWGQNPSGNKAWCIIAPIERYCSCRYFQ